MRIILDANIVIAALLGSKGKTIILTSQNHEFYAPEVIVEEIKKYKEDICRYASYTPQDFEIYLNALMVFVNIVEYDEYANYIKKAEDSMGDKHSKDFHYIACALAVNADFIWSDDKDFSCQKLVTVKTTNKFIEENRV